MSDQKPNDYECVCGEMRATPYTLAQHKAVCRVLNPIDYCEHSFVMGKCEHCKVELDSIPKVPSTPKETKETTALEEAKFREELKAHWEAHAQFGPFETEDSFRWFFLRGMDVGRELTLRRQKNP
jgi:hypothetical protein